MLEDSTIQSVDKFSKYLSDFGTKLVPNPFTKLLSHFGDPEIIFLGGGLPNPNLFPITELSFKTNTLTGSVITRDPKKDCKSGVHLDKSQQYSNGMGDRNLLAYIKSHVIDIHNPQYDEFEVMLTVGSSDSLYKAIKLTMNPGQVILVGKWAYPNALETFKNFELNLVAVDIDDEGLVPESMVEVIELWNSRFPNNKARAVPTGQNPTGATMGLERRKQVYYVCQLYDLIIIEDDPYYYLQLPQSIPDLPDTPSESELLNYFGFTDLVPSLLSMDVDGRVIRLDSYAKIITPGLRIGYVTANSTFCKKYKYFNEICTQFPSGYSQAILLKLLVDLWTENQFELQIAKIRYELYSRVEKLMKVLNKLNNDGGDKPVLKVSRPQAGMFFWLPLISTTSVNSTEAQSKLFDQLIENKVLVVPNTFFEASAYCKIIVKEFKGGNAYRISYCYEDLNLVIEGIRRLINALKGQRN